MKRVIFSEPNEEIQVITGLDRFGLLAVIPRPQGNFCGCIHLEGDVIVFRMHDCVTMKFLKLSDLAGYIARNGIEIYKP